VPGWKRNPENREPVMANIYQDGTYLENNSSWHEEDSPFKAGQIKRIIEKKL
jgi:hypothetical protein